MRKGMKFFKMTNGLDIYTVEKRDIPMVTILIAVKNGSFVENESNNGLAHLYEHMFFKANDKIPSQPEFMRTLDEMGIELGPNMNAYTSTESVRYFFTIQSQYLNRGIQFMADALITPKFLQDELEQERKVVIGEFDRYEASPQDMFYQRSITQAMFAKYFVRKNVIGTREVILNASHDQMLEIKNRYYIPNNSALFIVGDFDEVELKKALDKSFGNWKPGSDPFMVYPVPEHPPLDETKKFIDMAPVQNVSIVRAFQGPKLTKDDKACLALDLASHMLSFESSEFQKELVHSGIAVSAGFMNWSQRYTSPLFFMADAAPEHAQQASDKLNEMIDRVAKGGFFNEKDLLVAKNALEVHAAYDREVGQKYALALASVWTSTGSLDYYENYVEDIKKIGLADIDQALKSYIAGENYVLGGLVPTAFKGLNFPGMTSEPRTLVHTGAEEGSSATVNAIEAPAATNAVELPKTSGNFIEAPSKKSPKALKKKKAVIKKPAQVEPK